MVLLAFSAPLWAQVTLRNPQHLPVPEERVQVIFRTTCRVVAEQFRLHPEQLEFPLTLVLGEPNEQYSADEDTGTYTIYLNQWNEAKFTTSAMRLAVWRMVPRKRRDQLVWEILQRANRVAPVPAAALRGK